jgi:hypothetical protein
MTTGGAIALPAALLGVEPAKELLPADKKFGTAAAVVLNFSELQIHLRIHDYYLGRTPLSITIPILTPEAAEISLNTTPVHGHIDYRFLETLSYERTKVGQRMMTIDGTSSIMCSFNLINDSRQASILLQTAFSALNLARPLIYVSGSSISDM